MGWSFICPKNPLEPEWVGGAGLYRCSTCNKRHRAQQTGAPAKRDGIPSVVPDKVRKHFDYACGRVITSRSQRNRIYDKMGLARKSAAEYRRQHPHNLGRKPGSVINIPGVSNHRSSAERHGTFKEVAGDTDG